MEPFQTIFVMYLLGLVVFSWKWTFGQWNILIINILPSYICRFNTTGTSRFSIVRKNFSVMYSLQRLFSKARKKRCVSKRQPPKITENLVKWRKTIYVFAHPPWLGKAPIWPFDLISRERKHVRRTAALACKWLHEAFPIRMHIQWIRYSELTKIGLHTVRVTFHSVRWAFAKVCDIVVSERLLLCSWVQK